MSVLETPRIIFGGEISWDPIVTNNSPTLYNEETGWTDFDPGETVKQFRQSAINTSIWNPQGTHRSNFFDTEISGVDLGQGIERDSFVGSPVSLSGMLVDLEPYGGYTSQIFFDQISLGIDGGCRIFAPRTQRFADRYINFFRLSPAVYRYAASIASVIWQTSFSKDDGLQIDAHDSAALLALKSALENEDVLGLTVQFNSYSTRYYGAETDAEIPARAQNLVDNLNGGGFQPNPARSKIVGVVGLWRKGEPAQEPAGRAMLAMQAPPNPGTKWANANYVATALARVDDDKLTVDLSNSIYETDLAETKQNFGNLTFFAKDTASGVQTKLGSIDYAKYDLKSYLATAGIISIPLDSTQAKAAKDGLLQMFGGALPSVSGLADLQYLSEEQFRAVSLSPNIYFDANEGDSVNVDVLVLDKGVPVGKDVNVAMIPDPNNQSTQYFDPAQPPVPIPTVQALTNDNGIARFTIDVQTWKNGLIQGFVLVPNPDSSSPNSIDPLQINYMFIRVRPAGDKIGNLPPTWENVYQYCLSNWNAMAPCMDNWLDLNDEAQVKTYAKAIKFLTDPANFEAFRFMPVTRDMTAGQRKLLYKFLDSGKEDVAELAAESVEEPVNLVELSRQMRQSK